MGEMIVAINSGSSSLKFQLFEMPNERVVIKGLFEQIGEELGRLSYTIGSKKEVSQIELGDHRQAVNILLELLIEKKVIREFSEISGVGHRVAHGGEYFKESTILGKTEIEKIRELSQLAPIHNPVNLLGIEAFMSVLPNILPVGTFDTAFHQTLEQDQYIYPIPYEYYEKYRIRRYGFHGTSHQFVAQQALKLKTLPQDTKIISCHLGNGASICGIKDGQSVTTSMGFTPLSGVMMGTRSGDIDPSILPFIQQLENKSPADIEYLINYQSGLLGVSGISNDCREVQQAAAAGNQRASLALQLFVNRISSTIASFATDLGGMDLLIFTAGIGENSAEIRQAVCDRLTFMGVTVDSERNRQHRTWIESAGSRILVGVIPTDEELVIARDTYRLISKNK